MKNDYLTPDAVLCKGCGDKIVRIEDGIAYPLANYVVLRLEFDDGSAHDTPMCRRCTKDPSLDVAGIYAADVSQWEKELKKEGRKLKKELKMRSPVKSMPLANDHYDQSAEKVDRTKMRRRRKAG